MSAQLIPARATLMLIALIVMVLTAVLAKKDSPEMGHLVKVQANYTFKHALSIINISTVSSQDQHPSNCIF